MLFVYKNVASYEISIGMQVTSQRPHAFTRSLADTSERVRLF